MSPSFDLTIYHIRVTCETLTTVHFGIHAGAQWRGALWDTMRTFACTDPKQRGVPEHSWHCPMCFILALEVDSPRGVNPARPLVIRPPLTIHAKQDYTFIPGESFVLEFILIEKAINVFPYLIQAVQRIGQQGIGFGRGRFNLQRVEAFNPLTKSLSILYEIGRLVGIPDLSITGAQVAAHAERLPTDHMWLHFLTPTQLVQDGKVLSRPQLHILVIRLLERLQALEYHYGQPAPQEVWKTRHEALGGIAKTIPIRRDETQWIRAYSGSRRVNRRQDVSGFVGSVMIEGDMSSLRSWLLWASLVNVGKNAIKGNGWLEVSS